MVLVNLLRLSVRSLSSTCRQMILDSPSFKGILSEELIELVSLFKKHNYEIRIAGGAVRDLLMSKVPSDIDFATTATPEEMKAMFTEENVRMINAKGEKHGTITARIKESNFEVTTLRIDVVSDGRHAEVEFTKDWYKDANRRDLTINSMFLDIDGKVYDYFNGIEHVKEKRIVFVGEAVDRIQEDYLRILRYFRFYGKVVDVPDNHDEAVIEAIRANLEGLKRISGERIWTELSKILQGNHVSHLLKKMLSIGMGPYIGLPEVTDFTELTSVWERGKTHNLLPMTILASVMNSEDDLLLFCSRVKLPNFERDLGLFIIRNRAEVGQDLLQYQILYYRIGNKKPSESRQFIEELLKYKCYLNVLHQFRAWDPIQFPLTGNDLKNMGVPAGKQFGVILNKCKNHWLESEFKASKDELVELAKTLIVSKL